MSKNLAPIYPLIKKTVSSDITRDFCNGFIEGVVEAAPKCGAIVVTTIFTAVAHRFVKKI